MDSKIWQRRKRRDKVVSFASECDESGGAGFKKLKLDDGGGGGGLDDDIKDKMPLPERGRTSGSSRGEDRLGRIPGDMRSRGSGRSGSSRREDRLGRIESEWMLPGGNISRDNASSTASVAPVSTSSAFTSSSSGSQQQQQQSQPRWQLPVTSHTNQEITAPEESLFKGGGDTETVSTATNSLSTLFSSAAATTTEENKASIVDLFLEENKKVDLFSEANKVVVENKSTIDALFSSSVFGATEENKVDKPLAAVLTVSSPTETTTACSSNAISLGSPLPGFVSASWQQEQPPIHPPNNPPIKELLGGVIVGGYNSTSIPVHHFGGDSSLYTGVSSLGLGAVFSVSSLDARTVSSLGTGTTGTVSSAGTGSSFGTGTGSSFGTGRTASSAGTGFITMENDTSIFGSALTGRTRTTPAVAAPAPSDDSTERAAAIAAEQAMFKKTGVPKAAVHHWYGQKPRRQVISQENYITWHDNGPPHLMHYTSLFICPMSGEAFGSGRYGDAKHYKTDAHNPNIIWYKRKALAEHGAAARAFDCLVFREAGTTTPGSTMVEFRIGKDEPYLAAAAVPKGSSLAAFLAVPSHVPSHLRPEVEEIIRQGQAHMANAPPSTTNQDHDDDVEEAAWKKHAYERQHDHDMLQQSSQQYDDHQEMPQNEFFMDPTSNIFDDPP